MVIQVFLISLILLGPDAIKAQTERSKDSVFRITLGQGTRTLSMKKTLRPYAKHIYRFRGVAGREIAVQLSSPREEGDVVFWVQAKGWYPSGSTSALLAGIDKGGVMSWSGFLPETGDYEIYVSNPPVSNHVVRRSLPYRIEITVK